MRIVHISDCFAPRTGGIESLVGDLAAAQAARGHQVHVLTVTADPPLYTGTQEVGAVTVHRLAARWMLGVADNPLAAAPMRRALRQLQPDVVHVHFGVVSPFAWHGLRLARLEKLPALVTWHSLVHGPASTVVTSLAAGWRGWGRVQAELAAVSHAAATRVGKVVGRPVAVLPNAIDVAAWVPATAVATPRVGGPLRVVATQRLVARKRLAALVAAVARATAAAGTPIELTVVGAGPAAAKVRRAAQAAGLAGRVHLSGQVPRAELKELYATQDVFASAAVLEAFGIAGLEARAAGLPVLARSGTGFGEFITDGSDGILAADDAALAAALARVAGEPATLARMRAYAHAQRPIFDWDYACGTAQGLYEAAQRRA